MVVIQSFGNRGTEDIYHGRNTSRARATCPRELWTVSIRKLEYMDSADALEDLRVPPGNRLEALSGRREGQHSIRVNDQYRICFRWTPDGPADVELVDYH